MPLDNNYEWLSRQRSLIGDDRTQQLIGSSVAVFGVGGVGGHAVEALVRAGVGRITVIDHDTVAPSNINRQIIATADNIGTLKVEAVKKRCLSINPSVRIDALAQFANADNIEEIIDAAQPDYIIDAIDSVKSKLDIIKCAKEKGVPVISCMGTGNHLDPLAFKIADISKTQMCPLAKVMRRELRLLGIKGVDVLYSTEEPLSSGSRTPASISFVPGVAGMVIAGHVIKKLAEL